MRMSFLWESHGKRPMGWDGTGINCYGMGMGQINMSHGQACLFDLVSNTAVTCAWLLQRLLSESKQIWFTFDSRRSYELLRDKPSSPSSWFSDSIVSSSSSSSSFTSSWSFISKTCAAWYADNVVRLFRLLAKLFKKT